MNAKAHCRDLSVAVGGRRGTLQKLWQRRKLQAFLFAFGWWTIVEPLIARRWWLERSRWRRNGEWMDQNGGILNDSESATC